jgi:hypothetical protein
MIKPSIGRVVWFWPGSFDAALGNFSDKSQPLAAIVAYVWSDTMVNLAVFDPNGVSHNRTSVTLWQGDGERPAEFFAEWMPFQKGQAAKTEALEKAASAA